MRLLSFIICWRKIQAAWLQKSNVQYFLALLSFGKKVFKMKRDGWRSGSISSSSFIRAAFLFDPAYSFYHLASLNLFSETKCLQLCMPMMIDSKCTRKSIRNSGDSLVPWTEPESKVPLLLYGIIWGNYVGILLLSFKLFKSTWFVYFRINECSLNASQCLCLLRLL